jgi:hypothetical protein
MPDCFIIMTLFNKDKWRHMNNPLIAWSMTQLCILNTIDPQIINVYNYLVMSFWDYIRRSSPGSLAFIAAFTVVNLGKLLNNGVFL